MMLPPCIGAWLPENHPVHFVSEVAERPDLSAIYGDYRELRGQPPLMAVKVLMYAVSKGIHSSRKIERFRRRHHQAPGDPFLRTVRLCDQAGLVRMNHVSTVGTQIKANADTAP